MAVTTCSASCRLLGKAGTCALVLFLGIVSPQHPSNLCSPFLLGCCLNACVIAWGHVSCGGFSSLTSFGSLRGPFTTLGGFKSLTVCNGVAHRHDSLLCHALFTGLSFNFLHCFHIDERQRLRMRSQFYSGNGEKRTQYEHLGLRVEGCPSLAAKSR